MGQRPIGEHEHRAAGREIGVRLAQGQILDQVAALAAQAPGHRLTVETIPGRGERFVARAVAPGAQPYLVITDDLTELCAELGAGTGDETP
jgi:hypothetical protein